MSWRFGLLYAAAIMTIAAVHTAYEISQAKPPRRSYPSLEVKKPDMGVVCRTYRDWSWHTGEHVKRMEDTCG